MSLTTLHPPQKPESLVERARREVNEENSKKAIAMLKDKLRARIAAQTVIENLDREIADLEKAAEQGNI